MIRQSPLQPPCLISKSAVQHTVARMADQLVDRGLALGASELVFVPILTGAWYLAADLTRFAERTLPTCMEPIRVKSYSGRTAGELEILLCPLADDIRGRHVVLLDDIFDTGATLQTVVHLLEKLRPASLTTAVLLERSGKRRESIDVRPDVVGAQIADEFVVGYGLDYKGRFRGLSYIGHLTDRHIAMLDRSQPR